MLNNLISDHKVIETRIEDQHKLSFERHSEHLNRLGSAVAIDLQFSQLRVAVNDTASALDGDSVTHLDVLGGQSNFTDGVGTEVSHQLGKSLDDGRRKSFVFQH